MNDSLGRSATEVNPAYYQAGQSVRVRASWSRALGRVGIVTAVVRIGLKRGQVGTLYIVAVGDVDGNVDYRVPLYADEMERVDGGAP